MTVNSLSVLGRENQMKKYWSEGSSKSESCSVVSDSLLPHGVYSPWNSPGQNTGVRRHFPSPGGLPDPGIKLRSPALQADSLPTELPRKAQEVLHIQISYSTDGATVKVC